MGSPLLVLAYSRLQKFDNFWIGQETLGHLIALVKKSEKHGAIQMAQKCFDNEVHTLHNGHNGLARGFVPSLRPRIPMLQAQTAFQFKKEGHNFLQGFFVWAQAHLFTADWRDVSTEIRGPNRPKDPTIRVCAPKRARRLLRLHFQAIEAFYVNQALRFFECRSTSAKRYSPPRDRLGVLWQRSTECIAASFCWAYAMRVNTNYRTWVLNQKQKKWDCIKCYAFVRMSSLRMAKMAFSKKFLSALESQKAPLSSLARGMASIFATVVIWLTKVGRASSSNRMPSVTRISSKIRKTCQPLIQSKAWSARKVPTFWTVSLRGIRRSETLIWFQLMWMDLISTSSTQCRNICPKSLSSKSSLFCRRRRKNPCPPKLQPIMLANRWSTWMI